MENSRKLFKLANNKEVFIHFDLDDDTYYVINAYDKDDKLVAFCHFDIETTYRRKLTEIEREEYRKYFNGFSSVPKSWDIIHCKMDEIADDMLVSNNTLTLFKTGAQIDFAFVFATCHLQLIEIKDEKYNKSGLGTLLFNIMEEYAKEHQCSQIYGLFHPNGQFANGARPFYEKHNFFFEQNGDGRTYIYKSITPKLVKTPKFNTERIKN